IGFVLGPRLNAAGRINDAEDALRLLLTEDADEAKTLAERLEQRNTERQELTRQVVAGAREAAEERPDAWITIVADPQWPAGDFGGSGRCRRSGWTRRAPRRSSRASSRSSSRRSSRVAPGTRGPTSSYAMCACTTSGRWAPTQIIFAAR